jgi:hypothetical protein
MAIDTDGRLLATLTSPLDKSTALPNTRANILLWLNGCNNIVRLLGCLSVCCCCVFSFFPSLSLSLSLYSILASFLSIPSLSLSLSVCLSLLPLLSYRHIRPPLSNYSGLTRRLARAWPLRPCWLLSYSVPAPVPPGVIESCRVVHTLQLCAHRGRVWLFLFLCDERLSSDNRPTYS